MNKLEQLFATKAKIEEELENERQARILEEQKERNEKYRIETLERQNQVDAVRYNQCKEQYDRIISILGSKDNVDTEYYLYLFTILVILGRNTIDNQEFLETLKSVKRVLDQEQK